MTSERDTNLMNWPVDELTIELAQLLAVAAAFESERFLGARINADSRARDVWRAIVDKGGVIPERLRKQYASRPCRHFYDFAGSKELSAFNRGEAGALSDELQRRNDAYWKAQEVGSTRTRSVGESPVG